MFKRPFQLVGPPEVRWGNLRRCRRGVRHMDMVMVHGRGTLRSNGANSVGHQNDAQNDSTQEVVGVAVPWSPFAENACFCPHDAQKRQVRRQKCRYICLSRPRTLRKEQHGLVAVEIVQTPISKQSCSGGPGVKPGRIDDLNTGGPGYDQHIKNRAARPWQAHRDGDLRS